MDEEQAPEPLMLITEAVLRPNTGVLRRLLGEAMSNLLLAYAAIQIEYLRIVLESQPLDVRGARLVDDTWKAKGWGDWGLFKLGYLIHKRLLDHGSFYYLS
jgi:hypothetical protein